MKHFVSLSTPSTYFSFPFCTLVVVVVVVIFALDDYDDDDGLDTNGDGEISPQEFSAFFTRELVDTPDHDTDELGVIWARLRGAHTPKDVFDELHMELQKLQVGAISY